MALPPEMLQAQVEELAQVKVEAGSKFPVTLTGTILSNTVYNSGDANWLESPNIVGTAAGGSMTSTMRQSRLGFDVPRHQRRARGKPRARSSSTSSAARRASSPAR